MTRPKQEGTPMHKRSLAAMTAVGLAAAIAVPTIAFGNARNNLGSFNFEQVAQHAVHRPARGSQRGAAVRSISTARGAAAVTFDIINSADAAPARKICWDLCYSAIDTPTLAHIHTGAAGVANGPIVVHVQQSSARPRRRVAQRWLRHWRPRS